MIRANAEERIADENSEELEYDDVLNALSNRKSPGIDCINVEILKRSWGHLANEYMKLFNGCLKYATFSEIWKRVDLIVLMKGEGKDESDSKSRRPICFLPVVGKWMEKIVLIRSVLLSETIWLQEGEMHGRFSCGMWLRDVNQSTC